MARVSFRRYRKFLWAQVYTRNHFAHQLIAHLPQIHLDRPVFIVGIPRSGTTVLCQSVGSNRHLAHWSEAAMLWDPNWRSPEIDHRWTAEFAKPQRLRRVNNNFGYFARIHGCHRILNKHPRNSLRIPFLLAGWPDALLIHIQRDPRAVVNSLINLADHPQHRHRPLAGLARPEGWREIADIPDPVERFCRMVQGVHDTLNDDLRDLASPDQVLSLRYEDLVTDPPGHIRAIWSFCDLPQDDRALSKLSARLENRNFKWATRPEADLETMHRLLTPMLIETGYEKRTNWLDQYRTSPPQSPPTPSTRPAACTTPPRTQDWGTIRS